MQKPLPRPPKDWRNRAAVERYAKRLAERFGGKRFVVPEPGRPDYWQVTTYPPADPIDVDAYYARLERLRKGREAKRLRAVAEWKALTASGLA